MKIVWQKSRDLIDRRRGTIGGIAAVLAAVVAFLLGRQQVQEPDPDEDLVYLVSTALDRGQDFWQTRIPNYRRAKVVLYTKSTSTRCGRGIATSGPFYCPGDERIYLDLAFLRAFGSDFARAYVIAHELGHHVQKILGRIPGMRPVAEAELEADCLAGMWMRHEQTAGTLDAGDVSAAIETAASVGDDRLLPGSSPETWNHGSAEQRADAVRTGLSDRCPL